MSASPTLGASRHTRRPPQRQSHGLGGSSPCSMEQCKANLRSWSQPRGWSCSGALGRGTAQSAQARGWLHFQGRENLELPLGAIALAGWLARSVSNCKLPGSGQPLNVPAALSLPHWCCRNWPKDAWSKVRYQHSSKSHWVSVHFSVSWVASSEGRFHVQVRITLEEPSPGNTIMHLKHTGIPHEDE